MQPAQLLANQLKASGAIFGFIPNVSAGASLAERQSLPQLRGRQTWCHLVTLMANINAPMQDQNMHLRTMYRRAVQWFMFTQYIYKSDSNKWVLHWHNIKMYTLDYRKSEKYIEIIKFVNSQSTVLWEYKGIIRINIASLNTLYTQF